MDNSSVARPDARDAKTQLTGEHTALAVQSLLEATVALLMMAREGGWEIASTMRGNFAGSDEFVLRIWRTPPTPEDPAPVSAASPAAGSDQARDAPLLNTSEADEKR